MKVSQIVKRDLLTEKQFSAKKVDSLQKKKIKNKKIVKIQFDFLSSELYTICQFGTI
jgi:hypothetical protein